MLKQFSVVDEADCDVDCFSDNDNEIVLHDVTSNNMDTEMDTYKLSTDKTNTDKTDMDKIDTNKLSTDDTDTDRVDTDNVNKIDFEKPNKSRNLSIKPTIARSTLIIKSVTPLNPVTSQAPHKSTTIR
jgi:hypothetical protein